MTGTECVIGSFLKYFKLKSPTVTAGSIKTLYRETLRSDSNAGGRLSEGFFEMGDHLLS